MINTTAKIISILNKKTTYGQYIEMEKIDLDRLKAMYHI
jgi:hypothetical protein